MLLCSFMSKCLVGGIQYDLLIASILTYLFRNAPALATRPMNSLSSLLLLHVALSGLTLSHSACYMRRVTDPITGEVKDEGYCDTATVSTITEDSNGNTMVSAVMGGNATSDCAIDTKDTMEGADYAYDDSEATMFSFIDAQNGGKDSEFVDFASNEANNALYKEACENESTVNGTYVTLTYEALCTSTQEEGETVNLYVYDQPRCYPSYCSAGDPVPFTKYTIEPTIVRNHNNWKCIGDLDEDFDRCGIYQKRLDSLVDNTLAVQVEPQTYFFGMMEITDRKTAILTPSETSDSTCSENNGTMSDVRNDMIVKCLKDGESSMTFDFDGTFSLCHHNTCDTTVDTLSHFRNALVVAGEIGNDHVCVESFDEGGNWVRDNSHLIVIGVVLVLLGSFMINCMANRGGDDKAPGLPMRKKQGVSSL